MQFSIYSELQSWPGKTQKQIYEEAWRVNRDWFYDPTFHGADWAAVKKKYEPFLPHVTSSADLYRVIGWMLSELAVGHSRYTAGERVHERKTTPGGLLGADYEVADGRYRFKKIYGGLNWSPTFRSPLTAPGSSQGTWAVPPSGPHGAVAANQGAQPTTAAVAQRLSAGGGFCRLPYAHPRAIPLRLGGSPGRRRYGGGWGKRGTCDSARQITARGRSPLRPR